MNKLKLLFALILLVMMSNSAFAQLDEAIFMQTKKRLIEQLNNSSNPQQRIFFSQNLVDLYINRENDSLEVYRERLLTECLKANDEQHILETCREIGNSARVSEIERAKHYVSLLPPSKEKKGVELFLRCREASLKGYVYTGSFNMGSPQFQNIMSMMFKESIETDPYERYYLLFCLSLQPLYNKYSLIKEDYCEELLALTKQLGTDNKYIENQTLLLISNIYLSNENYDMSCNVIYRLLQNIQMLSDKYKRQDRYYRKYDFVLFNAYTHLLYNKNALSESELNNVLHKLDSLEQINPLIKNGRAKENLYCIYRDLCRKEYNKVLSRIKWEKVGLKSIPQLLEPRDKDKTSTLIFNAAKEAYAGVDDRKNLATVLTNQAFQQMDFIRFQSTIGERELEWYNHISEITEENQRLLLQSKLTEKKALNNKNIINKAKLEHNLLLINKKQREDSIKLANQVLTKAQNDLIIQNNEIETLKRTHYYRILVCVFFFLVILSAVSAWLFIKHKKINKQMEKNNQQLQKELELSKIDDQLKTTFVQNMSHEIRTPLNAIVGFSYCICDNLEETDEDTITFTNLIKSNSDLLLQLVNDILDLSLMESGMYKTAITTEDPVEVCQNVLESIKQKVPYNVALKFETQIKNCTIQTDRVRLQQLLINMLTNACKYTTKGEIKLEAKILNKENVIEFSVTDTGKGIPVEKANLVFERFEKLGSNVQGTGLGLHICKLITQRLNGHIFVDTSYTGGARMVIHLPLS